MSRIVLAARAAVDTRLWCDRRKARSGQPPSDDEVWSHIRATYPDLNAEESSYVFKHRNRSAWHG